MRASRPDRHPRRRVVLTALAAVAAGTCACLTATPVGAGTASPAAPVAAAARAAPIADRDRDGLSDRRELGATAASRPSLAPLTTALARRRSQPVRLLFLGSSTTYGVGASSPAAGFVDQVVARLQARFPAAPAAPSPPRGLGESTDRPDEDPGVQGINGGVGGSTAATYVTDAHEYAVRVLRPACVVHLIGSNDSVAEVPPATFATQVEAVVRRIDAASDRRPCHVLLQPVRRYQVDLEAWRAYRDALQQLAVRLPRATFVDLGSTFEAHDALGADPHDLIGPDAVHLTDAGHALLARTLTDALALTRRGLGTGTDPRRADTDRDGIADGREVRGYVLRQRVVACSGAVRQRFRSASVAWLEDTDGDGLADRQEAGGHRLRDGRVVRTDPSDADTDGDRRSDGREAARRGADPTTCE
ncbi:SGNH/GDSL hydrolase family protein [Nocardioides xinjiangensis]|uniref:SGNH/GDSL hydrolase family protein n=1 Tax=Nocardioides xinjiangensis TaxID=2817376 RepID=UPI001B3062EB|nr:SGNH/GDSL hydrolase family protein [Nocardioides sp. SYSU D00778]